MSNDRFVRWQEYTISEFTFAINLFFGLAVGALTFSITFVKNDDFFLWPCLRLLFMFGFVSLCFSVFAGCAAVVSRLMDFRLTAQKIKRKSKESNNNELGIFIYKTKLLGRISWRLFWIQLATFIAGLLSLLVTMVVKVCNMIL